MRIDPDVVELREIMTLAQTPGWRLGLAAVLRKSCAAALDALCLAEGVDVGRLQGEAKALGDVLMLCEGATEEMKIREAMRQQIGLGGCGY